MNSFRGNLTDMPAEITIHCAQCCAAEQSFQASDSMQLLRQLELRRRAVAAISEQGQKGPETGRKR